MSGPSVLDRRALWLLGAGVALLAVLNLLDLLLGRPFWTVTRMIYLGVDTNAAAWYSSVLLAFAGLVAAECAVLAARIRRGDAVTLGLFSALLFFMSCDEIATMHEILGAKAAEWAGVSAAEFARHSPWVWFGAPVILLVFAAFAVRLRGTLVLVHGSQRWLVLGMAAIVLGGVVLEAGTNWLNHDELQWVWDLEIVAEETLEMAGSVFLALGFATWRDGMAEGEGAP